MEKPSEETSVTLTSEASIMTSIETLEEAEKSFGMATLTGTGAVSLTSV